MTQSVVVQVGQCGNQIGCRFWELALQEYAHFNKKRLYDDATGAFFHNVDLTSRNKGVYCSNNGVVQLLKARAVLLDMEERVISQMMKGSLRDVFDHTQVLTGMSGAGNNWAVGYMMYGLNYKDKIVEQLRKAAEQCDCLQSFFLIHSTGGGTGSGLGTRVLSLLKDEFPEVCRIVTPVFPSVNDDVVVSPYNTALALRELTENADCVLPVENQSLEDILNMQRSSRAGRRRPTMNRLIGSEYSLDARNEIVANMLLNLTSAARFDGSLNMDLNEIAMNLVPFPQMHYLVPSLSPLYTLADVGAPSKRMNQLFNNAFSRSHQLIKADPKHSLYLACSLVARGNVQVSDLRRNIDRLKPSLHFVSWNPEGWKTSLCSVPPVGHSQSLLVLANNTAVKSTFMELREQFIKLYRNKAHLHHYLQVDGMEQSLFSEAVTSLDSLIEEYHCLDVEARKLIPDAPRIKIAK
ncbi:tubulin epsilon chain [Corythoichthys intestinalis]|uniref:tubulin epsilon chain n=1 Tax=Corythoichthys intestinalis TaxID=161448 RepID=UPI0025A648FE|nr:tubulin epsilon chain [Corythoichthys intestinalis]XP_061809013.1 tubulin epsilon chain-like [Nerophis lumbriciformis]